MSKNKLKDKLAPILNVISIITIIWTFLSIVTLILDFFGVLPWYDIQYRKKTDITPIVNLYPGEKVRLCPEFATPVASKNIKSIIWNLRNSSGEEYIDPPTTKDVDLTLLPDYSGILNVEVTAILDPNNQERFGKKSLHIVQTEPYKLKYKKVSIVTWPLGLQKDDLKGMEIYEGAAKWSKTYAIYEKHGFVQLAGHKKAIPIWDGMAYFRYKSSKNPTAPYQYETARALDWNLDLPINEKKDTVKLP